MGQLRQFDWHYIIVRPFFSDFTDYAYEIPAARPELLKPTQSGR
jgi:hypothetical protein